MYNIFEERLGKKMAIELCPHCKLNYVKPGMKYCRVCMNDFKDIDNKREVCPMCGENPLEENEDLCTECLKKRIDMSGYTIEDGNLKEESESSDDEFEGMRVMDLDEEKADDTKDDFGG